MLYRLTSRFFVLNSLPIIEQAMEFHLYAYQEMVEIEKNKRLIVSLMFLNFILVKNEVSCIQIQKKDLKNYLIYKELFYNGEKEKMLFLILELIKQSKHQPKAYYIQLRELDFKEVFHTVFKDKELLKNEYRIQNLYVFGSFAKNKQRIDSDIDFLVRFSEDLTYEEKCENIEKLSNHYSKIFNRVLDFTEVEQYLTDDFIKVMSNVKIIF